MSAVMDSGSATGRTGMTEQEPSASEELQESRKTHQPLGPGTVAAFRVEVAGVAGINYGRAPSIGDVLCLGVVAMWVGSARNQNRRKQEGIARNRRKGAVDGRDEVGPLHVRHADQEGALHLAPLQERGGVRNGEHAEAVAYQHDG